MTIYNLLMILIVLGVGFTVLNYVKIPQPFKQILSIVLVVCFVVWVLNQTGLLHHRLW